MDKQRLYVDMDGTLAVFQKVDKLEALYEKGYFKNLMPIPTVILAVKHMIQHNTDIEVHILSAVLTDSKYALAEKNEWLDKYLPEIDREHRIFTPCGEDKKDYIRIRETDFLLDDYTYNLSLWQPPARGIKLLNGINHTHGSWTNDCIRYDKHPFEIARNIVSVMRGTEKIVDNNPKADRKIMDKLFNTMVLVTKEASVNDLQDFEMEL